LENKEVQSQQQASLLKTKEIEFCEAKAALETSETHAKKFEAESIKLQNELIELTLELENSRKPGETNQEGL